jgi:hypothetical protein
MYPGIYHHFMIQCRGEIEMAHPNMHHDTWYETLDQEIFRARLAEACMQGRQKRFSANIIEEEIKREKFMEEAEAARKGCEPRPLRYDHDRVFRQRRDQTSLFTRASRYATRVPRAVFSFLVRGCHHALRRFF